MAASPVRTIHAALSSPLVPGPPSPGDPSIRFAVSWRPDRNEKPEDAVAMEAKYATRRLLALVEAEGSK